jgi:soluble lytic murein transglycosylase-like protein
MKDMIAAIALGTAALAGCAPTGSAPEASVNPREKLAQTPKPSWKDSPDSLIAYYAKANDVPESLIHTAIKRESGYDPSLKHGPFWGLMQIRYDTARSMGYSGPPKGLLDPDVNLAHAVPYLANAYRVADGNERRAIRLYARGYYYEAKRRGLLKELRTAKSMDEDTAKSAQEEQHAELIKVSGQTQEGSASASHDSGAQVTQTEK